MSGLPALPIARDVAFLARHGVPVDVLREATLLGARCEVTAARAALATGLVSDEAFYRALAVELGLPFLEPGFAAHSQAHYPGAIRHGIAPLAEGGYALAPEDAALEGLLDRRGRLVSGLFVTTPAALRDAVFRARAPVIAREAAEALPRLNPGHSFHDGLTSGQTMALLALFAMVAAAGWLAGRPAWLALMIMMGSPFLLLAGIKLAAILEPSPVRLPLGLPRAEARDLPVYTVLVPLHRERRVLPKLRAALLALDYPPPKLDVKLLIEEGDAETREAIAELAWPGFVETIIVPAGHPRTKPRALNVGLALARGDYLVVYDAEDEPDPAQLREAALTFDRVGTDVACLQARLVIDNTDDGLLQRFFTLEYGALFDVLNPALARFDLPMPLGGTSNHLRVAPLRALGGWDPWNVTEDADLGVRLALAGFRVLDLPSATHEEAPPTLRIWLAQRARWMKGFVQVAITHSRDPLGHLRRLGTVPFAGTALLIAGTVVSCAVYPLFTAVVIGQLLTGTFFGGETPAEVLSEALSLTLAAAGLLAMTVPAFVGLHRRGWWRLWPFALAMPLYYVLVSLAAWRGIVELLIDPDRWNKTDHGLARTSRRLARPGGS
ncbi:glycosyltransferase family 2 protein [Enterovirga rhinocerotis]|uniref:Cellulose synthase/poly-beta-1,6-N-acetylglucosamine synthase-like glycosyltransferase n=1 Tax=Enterovirga rhinocerotis TaxID=1339210 RepID=A0A4R7BJG4_9HYPH|nr:glycosyltransferase family 2 protein [Enterovirga rhinocerotis]TDR85408.1 cellulose synthase/poly-beta-1,6-N-acetylglucosamine synthase-like glycosyltransferase [Enterovirga rhinocerotis]